MNQLFWPMLALFIWTFLVTLRNLQVRLAAMRARQLKETYFEIFQGDAPAEVVKVSNHLRNLTEFPPLFYIAIILVVVAGRVDAVFGWLAWGYVVLRVGHSLIHLSINKVKPRFAMFLASQLLLLAIWVRLAWQLA